MVCATALAKREVSTTIMIVLAQEWWWIHTLGQPGHLLCFRFPMVSSILGLSQLSSWNIWHQLLSHTHLLSQWAISFCTEICVNLEKGTQEHPYGGHVWSVGEPGEIGFAQITIFPYVETSGPKVNQAHTGPQHKGSSEVSSGPLWSECHHSPQVRISIPQAFHKPWVEAGFTDSRESSCCLE